jgi:hypothetical protein
VEMRERCRRVPGGGEASARPDLAVLVGHTCGMARPIKQTVKSPGPTRVA